MGSVAGVVPCTTERNVVFFERVGDDEPHVDFSSVARKRW